MEYTAGLNKLYEITRHMSVEEKREFIEKTTQMDFDTVSMVFKEHLGKDL